MKRLTFISIQFLLGITLLVGCQKESGSTPPSASVSDTGLDQAQAQGNLPQGHPPAGQGGAPQLPPDAPNPMEEIMAMKARLDKNPKDLEALISLGNANMMISRTDAAQDLYKRALAINPKDTDVRINLAVAYRTSGKLDDAVRELKKTLDQDPKNDAGLYNLGFIYYYDKKDSAAALDVWKKWLAFYPNAPNAAHVSQQISQIEAGSGMKQEPQASKPPH
jgi:cytochrome c-type biogenesis protein CcmH/NrfG